MKNFLLLRKVILKDSGEMDMPTEGRRKGAYRTLGGFVIGLIILPCCFIVGAIIYIMTVALMEAGGLVEGMELIIQIMSIFAMVFSVMVLFNVLYFSTDNDHLLPLPVKPGELVAAKLTYAYFAESLMEFAILMCGFIGFFIAAGVKPVSLIISIIGAITLPILPFAYCGFFAIIVMAFFSRARFFRNVDLMTTLVSWIFLGFFVVSFVQMDTLNVENYLNSLMTGENFFINVMGKIFFTVPIFLKAVETNSILYSLLYLLVNAAIAALLFFVGDKLYLRGVYMVSSFGPSGRKAKAESRNSSFSQSGTSRAYFLKECKILYRTPAYRKNCVLVNLLWPVIVAALFIMPMTKDFMHSFTNLFEEGYVATDIITLLFVVAISFFVTSMNSIAATSFSRDGAHFSFIKYVPIDYKKQVRIKAAVGIVYSGITVLVSIIVLCAFMGVSPLMGIYFCIIGLLSVVCCTYIGIMLDSTHPKLTWEDEYGALRGNLNAFFNMAISILFAAVMCLVGYILFRYTMLYTDVIFIGYLLIFAIITFWIRRLGIIYAVKNIKNDLYN